MVRQMSPAKPKRSAQDVVSSMKRRAEDKEHRCFRRRIDKRLAKDKDGILTKCVKWFKEKGQPVDEGSLSASDDEKEAKKQKKDENPSAQDINKNFTKFENTPLSTSSGG